MYELCKAGPTDVGKPDIQKTFESGVATDTRGDAQDVPMDGAVLRIRMVMAVQKLNQKMN